MFLGLRFNPEKDYEFIANARQIKPIILMQILLTALIPIISGYIGFSKVGVITPAGSILKLSETTTLYFSLFLFISYITSILLSGYLIFSSRKIFDANISAHSSLLFAYYCSIPFVFASISFLLPYAMLNFVSLLCAILYSVKMLYMGLYKIANIEPEAGFSYSSLIVGGIMIGFIAWISLLTIIYINFSDLFQII